MSSGFATFLALTALAANADLTPNSNALDKRGCLPNNSDYPFCDSSKPIETRVADLVGRIQAQDKGPFATARGSPRGNLASAPYIGLPAFDWGENSLHGNQVLCMTDTLANGTKVPRCSTSFPMPNSLGNSFNRTAVRSMGLIIGMEIRAQWLAGAEEASTWSGRPPISPNTWSPTQNCPRSPRWGRFQEVPSESPFWLGEYSHEYLMGSQWGIGPQSLLDHAGLKQGDGQTMMSITCLKHFVAYSLEDSDGFTRHNFNAIVPPFDFADTYLKPFGRNLQGNMSAKSVMCSYNAVNGQPTCSGGGGGVLKTYLRERWQSDAMMTSDTGAIADIYEQHHTQPDAPHAVCDAIVNGSTDMNSGDVFWHNLEAAVNASLCSWSDVDTAVSRNMILRFRLGMLDDPSSTPYWNVPLAIVGSPAHVAEAMQASRDSLAMLKNNKNTLPFRKGQTVAVIGPHSQSQSAQVGSYLGQLCSNPSNDPNDFSCIVTPEDAIASANAGGKVLQSTGCEVTTCTPSGIDAAVATAKQADVVVLVVGSDQSVEGESHDRTSIDLPGQQHELIAAVAAAGKPTAVIVFRGGPVDITAERDNDSVGSIIDAGFPGMYGAQAIAGAVFGDFSPGGRIATHVYPANYTSQINMTDMRMAFGPVGRGPRYLAPSATVYPFGTGLSYSTFKLAFASSSGLQPGKTATLPTDGTGTVSAVMTVTNTGSMRADSTLLARFSIQSLPPGSPVAKLQSVLVGQLFDFARVTLSPGQSTTVAFSISAETLRLVEPATGNTVIAPGTFAIEVSDFTNTITSAVSLSGSLVTIDEFPASGAAAYEEQAGI